MEQAPRFSLFPWSPPSPGARRWGAPKPARLGAPAHGAASPQLPWRGAGCRVRRVAEASPRTPCPFDSRTGERHVPNRIGVPAPGRRGAPVFPLRTLVLRIGSELPFPGPSLAAPAEDLTCAGSWPPPLRCQLHQPAAERRAPLGRIRLPPSALALVFDSARL